MKVGILTFHQTTNYGAMLQAYGLWRAVEEAGHYAEIIDYRPRASTAEYLKCAVVNRYPLARISQYLKLMPFLKKHARLSPRTFYTRNQLDTIADDYDLVIAGSDEIWNLEKPYIQFDPSYFLDFVNPPVRLASYAASFGEMTDLKAYPEALGYLFDRFRQIGVRDSNSARHVEKCGKQAVKVLDPTFLAGYEKLAVMPGIKEPYLLLYCYKLTPGQNAEVVRLARQRGLRVVSVGNPNESADINRIDASVEEWLGLYQNASYVITSYYHGMIFAMLNRKSFNVFRKPKKTVKINDLLGELGLESRVVDEQRPLEAQAEEIDYGPVFEKIEDMRIDSQGFLQDLFEAINPNEVAFPAAAQPAVPGFRGAGHAKKSPSMPAAANSIHPVSSLQNFSKK